MAQEQAIDVVLRGRNLTQEAFKAAEAALASLGLKLKTTGDESTSTSGAMGGLASRMAEVAGGMIGAQAILGTLGSAFSFVKNATIDVNSSLETTTQQFATMMGSTTAAGQHVKDLFDFAAKTPFETKPIIEASRFMRLFGGDALDTQENLRRVGDAAAVSGKPIDDVGMQVGKLYQALKNGTPLGEPMQRLMEMGVVSGDLRGQIEDLSHTAGGGQKAWEIFTTQLDKNKGSMEKMAGTWAGVTSTLADNITNLTGTAFKPLFELVRDGIAVFNGLLGDKTFQDGAKDLAVSISSGIVTAFKTFKETIVDVRDGVHTLGQFLEDWKGPLGAVAFGIGTVSAALKVQAVWAWGVVTANTAAAFATTGLGAAMTGVKVAMAFVTGPVGLAIIAITSLALAAEHFAGGWGPLWDKVKSAVMFALQPTIDKVMNLYNTLRDLGQMLGLISITLPTVSAPAGTMAEALKDVSYGARAAEFELSATGRATKKAMDELTAGRGPMWEHKKSKEELAQAEKLVQKANQDTFDSIVDCNNAIYDLDHSTKGVGDSLQILGGLGETVAVKMRTLAEEVEALQRAGQHMSAFWKEQGANAGMMGKAPSLPNPNVSGDLDPTASWGTTFQGTLNSLPSIMSKAMTGGGGMSGALGAFGSELGGSVFGKDGVLGKSITTHLAGLTGTFGKALSGVTGAALPIVGSLIGPGIQLLWKGITKLFGGPSKEELAGRDLVSSFEQQIAGMLTVQQKAEAGGEKWKMTVIGVRDAYLSTGHTAAEAQAAVERIWKSSKDGAEASKAAIDEVNRVMTEGQAQVIAAQAESKKNFEESQGRMQTALDDLNAQRKSLNDSIANEAPEEVMGVIETGMRAQIQVLNAQVDKQQADLAAGAADYADALERELSDIAPKKVIVDVGWNPDPFPGAGGGSEQPEGFATGGFRDFGAGTLAMLHGREAIIPVDRPSAIGAQIARSNGGGNTSTGDGRLTRLETAMATLAGTLATMPSDIVRMSRDARLLA